MVPAGQPPSLEDIATAEAFAAKHPEIPAGVWHLFAAIGPEEAHLINFPTEPYQHDAPDRILLPWDADELPV